MGHTNVLPLSLFYANGVFETLTSATIFKKYGVKYRLGTGTPHPEIPFGAHLHTRKSYLIG